MLVVVVTLTQQEQQQEQQHPPGVNTTDWLFREHVVRTFEEYLIISTTPFDVFYIKLIIQNIFI